MSQLFDFSGWGPGTYAFKGNDDYVIVVLEDKRGMWLTGASVVPFTFIKRTAFNDTYEGWKKIV